MQPYNANKFSKNKKCSIHKMCRTVYNDIKIMKCKKRLLTKKIISWDSLLHPVCLQWNLYHSPKMEDTKPKSRDKI